LLKEGGQFLFGIPKNMCAPHPGLIKKVTPGFHNPGTVLIGHAGMACDEVKKLIHVKHEWIWSPKTVKFMMC
jgi:hypothetical protein